MKDSRSFILLLFLQSQMARSSDYDTVGGISIFGLPVIILFSLISSIFYLKFRNLIVGIIASLGGMLASLWVIALLEDGRSEDLGPWAIVLLVQWMILLLGLIRRRY